MHWAKTMCHVYLSCSPSIEPVTIRLTVIQEVDALGKDYVPGVSELLNMPYVDGVSPVGIMAFKLGNVTEPPVM
jgi:hypothetical protein